MTDFVYTPAKRDLLKGDLDLDAAGDKVWAMLVMTNTTADTEKDTALVGDITTLDEYDGTGYVRKACANQTVTEVDASDLAKWAFDAITWTSLGAGTRQAAAVVLYVDADNDGDPADDAANRLLAYIDSNGLPFTGDGTNVVYTPHANGVLAAT